VRSNRSRFILILLLTASLTTIAGIIVVITGIALYDDFASLVRQSVIPTAFTTPTTGPTSNYPPQEERNEYYQPTQNMHRMTWQFSTFVEPCFKSEVVDTFTPQYVTVLYKHGSWAKLSASHGESWVYISSNRLYINRIVGVFDRIDGEITQRLQPQIINIVERQDNWVKIYPCLGWIDLYFQPPIHILEEFMSQFGNTVSVFYENMASGFIFRHHADHDYFGASATKAQFALYIYLKTEQGYASMNDIHTFTPEDFWTGSGIIRQRYSYGQTFTQRQLLHLMITPSDNIATRILRRVHGLNGYIAFMESIGANPNFVHNLTYSRLSANDAGIFLRAAYEYIASNGRYSLEFKNNLLANRYAFIISDYPVASKSGWAANFGAAWHDQAIVFAPSPYTLALLSSRAGNAADRRVYDAISMFIQNFNNDWFVVNNSG